MRPLLSRCHDESRRGSDELDTEECYRLIDQIAEVNKGCLLVITGGEPLVRPDILDIARHAVKLGFIVVFGTNGMLINDRMAKTLVEIGVMGMGISIDSLDPEKHDKFRGVPGAFASAMAGIEACKRNGLQFQVHFSAQPMNYQELPAVVEWAHTLRRAGAQCVFHGLHRTGRGTDRYYAQQYEEVLGYLVDCQDQYKGHARASPLRSAFQTAGVRKRSQFAVDQSHRLHGRRCLAGTNYARVTPNGELTPCPYMPLSAGNIRETSFVDLWEKSDVFNSFRYPQLKGKCGDCEYTDICGGCRARPYVDHGDWLDEDQWCLYTPKGGEKIKVAFNTPEETDIAWDEASDLDSAESPTSFAPWSRKAWNATHGKTGSRSSPWS